MKFMERLKKMINSQRGLPGKSRGKIFFKSYFTLCHGYFLIQFSFGSSCLSSENVDENGSRLPHSDYYKINSNLADGWFVPFMTSLARAFHLLHVFTKYIHHIHIMFIKNCFYFKCYAIHLPTFPFLWFLSLSRMYFIITHWRSSRRVYYLLETFSPFFSCLDDSSLYIWFCVCTV